MSTIKDPYVSIKPADDTNGFTIIDHIEHRHVTYETNTPIHLEPVSNTDWIVPITTAVRFSTRSITIPKTSSVFIRELDGTMVGEYQPPNNKKELNGEYILEISIPYKLYLIIDGSFTIHATLDHTTISFNQETSVIAGTRSYHEKPDGTITITDDIIDVMKAVSTFRTSLKDTSPERSFPTLRGHPPEIEFGPDLDIPDELKPPPTQIQFKLRKQLDHVFSAAPAAYYLNADVIPNGTNQLIVGDDVYELPDGSEFHQHIERLFKHVFYLDCVTRTEGLYPFDFLERNRLEKHASLPFEDWYNFSLVERTNAYLDVPFDTTKTITERWRSETFLSPTFENTLILPYLVDYLTLIKTVDQDAFTLETLPEVQSEAVVRGAHHTDVEVVSPPSSVGVNETLWGCDTTPVGAGKPLLDGFKNNVRSQPTEGDFTVTIVCNEQSLMGIETTFIDTEYAQFGDGFDVTVHNNLTTHGLRRVLQTPSNYFHYVGHLDDEGFRCVDGHVDVNNLEEVNVDTFFLNTCNSYNQGQAMIQRGAISGIVTLRDVVSDSAVNLGMTIGQFIGLGFPLYSALDVASKQFLVGNDYLLLGHPGTTVKKPDAMPSIVEITDVDNNEYALTCHVYNREGMGEVIAHAAHSNNTYMLCNGEVGTFSMSRPELLGYVDMNDYPLIVDGTLLWPDATIDDIDAILSER